MTLPTFTAGEWALAGMAGLFCGVGKAGLPGLGLLNVLIMARLIPGTASSGVVLPMLIAADVLACAVFGLRHVDWRAIARLAGPIALGLLVGWQILAALGTGPAPLFRVLVGWMVLAMIVVQLVRARWSAFDRALPQSRLFAGAVGLLVGAATMIANAAGPISTIYFLILGFAKREFVVTMAWLFLLVNLAKVPLSASAGLITPASLQLNLWLLPAIIAGFFLGRLVVEKIPQRPFERLILALTLASALHLILAP